MTFPKSSKLVLFVLAAAIAASPLAAQEKTATPKADVKVDASPVGESSGKLVTSYADVVEPVQKAVVSVYSTKIVRQRAEINPLLRQFFGDQLKVPERESKEEGLGSGVIVAANGYIITNNHVVAGADELNVLLSDGREFKAKLIGTDDKTDVAVIKIDVENLPTLALADSDKLRVGDVVFAVGNPLGVGQSVTMGIVSATGRNGLRLLEDVGGYENFIQTDAAINMGNSGGALVDAKGRLIGINTAIISRSSGNIGIGFAIPVNQAAGIMHSLIATGSVQRGYLGISGDSLTADLAESLGLKKDTKGVMVTDLNPADGPAAKAGIKRNDVVVAINERATTTLQDLRNTVSQFLPGTEVTVKILRDGKDRTLKAALGKLPADEESTNELLPGVIVANVDDDMRRQLNLDPRINGVVISDMKVDSPHLDRLPIKGVIVEINRVPTPDVATAREQLRPGRNLILVYFRGTFRAVTVLVK